MIIPFMSTLEKWLNITRGENERASIKIMEIMAVHIFFSKHQLNSIYAKNKPVNYGKLEQYGYCKNILLLENDCGS